MESVAGNLARGFCVAALMLLVACGDAQGPAGTSLPPEGLTKMVKAFGKSYSSQVALVNDGVVHWQTKWGDQVVSERKSYLNLFDISVEEVGDKVINKFNRADLDALFPLKIGNEVTFTGVRKWLTKGFSAPFTAQIVVRDETVISVEGKEYEVFVIDTFIDVEMSGEVRRAQSTLWRAKDHAVNLMVNIEVAGQKFWSRVVALALPEGVDAPSSVGTTLI